MTMRMAMRMAMRRSDSLRGKPMAREEAASRGTLVGKPQFRTSPTAPQGAPP